MNLRKSFTKSSLIRLLAIAFLVLLCNGVINSLSAHTPEFDSSVFMSVGWHMKSGHVLYRDIWDMKPPVIHFVNYVASLVGDNQIDSVRSIEKIFLILGTLSFLGIAYLFCNSFLIAFVSAMFFVHYISQEALLQGGNLTEEYACSLLLMGIFTLLLYLQKQQSKCLLYLSGISFSLAVLTKETFIISVVPWLLYYANSSRTKQLAERMLPLLTGMLIPLAVFLLYFLKNESLLYWYDNFIYSTNRNASALDSFAERIAGNMYFIKKLIFSVSVAGMTFFSIAVLGLFKNEEVKKLNNLPLFICLAFLTDYLATMISDKGFGHYYLQIIPSFSLLVCFGLHLTREYLAGSNIKLIVSIPLLIFVVNDYLSWSSTLRKIGSDFKKPEQSEISKFIKSSTKQSDYIWSPSAPNLYVEAERASPVRLHFFHNGLVFNSHLASSEEHLKNMKRGLYSNMPKFIFISEADRQIVFSEGGDLQWFRKNYTATLYSNLFMNSK